MNSVLKYFDLVSELRPRYATATAEREKSLHWLPQYVALFLGILVQPFLATYQATGSWDLSGFTGRIFFSLIVGIIIFPSAYKSAFDPQKPMFVQLCVILASGMGWESLLKTIVGR
jgi:hypothetical protein